MWRRAGAPCHWTSSRARGRGGHGSSGRPCGDGRGSGWWRPCDCRTHRPPWRNWWRGRGARSWARSWWTRGRRAPGLQTPRTHRVLAPSPSGSSGARWRTWRRTAEACACEGGEETGGRCAAAACDGASGARLKERLPWRRWGAFVSLHCYLASAVVRVSSCFRLADVVRCLSSYVSWVRSSVSLNGWVCLLTALSSFGDIGAPPDASKVEPGGSSSSHPGMGCLYNFYLY